MHLLDQASRAPESDGPTMSTDALAAATLALGTAMARLPEEDGDRQRQDQRTCAARGAPRQTSLGWEGSNSRHAPPWEGS